LSEDYLLETEAGRLVEIEATFDRHMRAIDRELERLSSRRHPLRTLASGMQRLKFDFSQDAKATFAIHGARSD